MIESSPEIAAMLRRDACPECGRRYSLRERLESVPVGSTVEVAVDRYQSHDTLRGAIYNAARGAQVKIRVHRRGCGYLVERRA